MLTGKKALVSGASRGIGRAIALRLAQAGADVAVLYASNAQAAEETCDLIRQEGRVAVAIVCDVADGAAVAVAVKQAIDGLGGLDILVNNAGITRDALLPMMKEQDFTDVLSTNLAGAWHLIRHTCRQFIKQRSGRIINISSVVGIRGNPGQANYAAAKAGMIGLTKSVARELAARAITCNAVAPGFIDTDMTKAMPEQHLRAALAQVPLNRIGTPQDVAGLVAFLADDEAAYITGCVIPVDGGMCA